MFLLLLAVSCVFVFLYWMKARRKSHPPLPPGPPADPLIGHLLKIPSQYQEETFYEWGKIYGDVMYLHILGRPIVVLNSVEAAVDLLDKRSANYSDRPRFVIYEIMGWNRVLTFLKYGKKFQKHRRYLQQYLNKNTITTYQPIQTREANVLLQKLASGEGDWDVHLERFATAIIIRVACGHQITTDDDPFVAITRGVSHALGNSGSPASTPVDFFPFLGYLPAWFPGAFYGGFARDNKFSIDQLHKYPYERVKKEMATGTPNPSFITHELETLDRDGLAGEEDDILDIQGAVAAMYSAGAETTSSTLAYFVLLMVLHPEVQERAQEEIDAVIGPGRLPEFSDRDALPFVECIYQETLRWHGVVPLGVPHRSLEDDVYKGMFIPAGSVVIANARAMTLDERIYKDPHAFNPARYLPRPEGDDEPYANGPFGFGRRICPGRHLAEASVWIGLATMLATLTISKAIGEDGKEITPEKAFTSGLTSQPKPFKCRMKPRNKQAAALIAQADTWESY